MKKIFEFKSYKEYLKYRFGLEGRGAASRLASALECQKSYLSQVLTGKPHLTSDHIYLLSRYWQFNQKEEEYFKLLVEYAKSSNKKFRLSLQQTLKEKQALGLQLNAVLDKNEHTPKDEHHASYYSHWAYAAVHYLLACESEGMNKQKISQKLSISQDKVNHILLKLSEMGLVAQKGLKWLYAKDQPYINSKSPLYPQWQNQWRSKTSENSTFQQEDVMHYTGLHTVSKDDYFKILDLMRQTLKQTHRIMEPSEARILINLNIDLWQIASDDEII